MSLVNTIDLIKRLLLSYSCNGILPRPETINITFSVPWTVFVWTWCSIFIIMFGWVFLLIFWIFSGHHLVLSYSISLLFFSFSLQLYLCFIVWFILYLVILMFFCSPVLPSIGIGALSAREAEGRTNISAGEKVDSSQFLSDSRKCF